MKKGLAFLCVAIVMAVVAFPAFAAGGGPGKWGRGAAQYPFYLCGDVLGTPPCSGYDIPGSSGKVVVNQPSGLRANGQVPVVITAIFNGLEPTTLYILHIANYKQPDFPGWSHGGTYPEVPHGAIVGVITSDVHGHAEWHMNIFAGDWPFGSYVLSLWLEQHSPRAIILVSDNFEVDIW